MNGKACKQTDVQKHASGQYVLKKKNVFLGNPKRKNVCIQDLILFKTLTHGTKKQMPV